MLGATFTAGILSIGGASSPQRQGPSVQRASARGSNLTSAVVEPKQHHWLAALLGTFVGHVVVGQRPSFTPGAVESSGWALDVPMPLVADSHGTGSSGGRAGTSAGDSPGLQGVQRRGAGIRHA